MSSDYITPKDLSPSSNNAQTLGTDVNRWKEVFASKVNSPDIKTLSDGLIGETQARVAADDALSDRVDDEEQERINADNALSGRIDGKADTNHSHLDATITNNGFMSAADKVKVDALKSMANIDDVASDNKTYGRKDGKWEIIESDIFPNGADTNSLLGYDGATKNPKWKRPNEVANTLPAGSKEQFGVYRVDDITIKAPAGVLTVQADTTTYPITKKWRTVVPLPVGVWHDIAYNEEKGIVAIAGANNKIAISLDDGETWELVYSDPTPVAPSGSQYVGLTLFKGEFVACLFIGILTSADGRNWVSRWANTSPGDNKTYLHVLGQSPDRIMVGGSKRSSGKYSDDGKNWVDVPTFIKTTGIGFSPVLNRWAAVGWNEAETLATNSYSNNNAVTWTVGTLTGDTIPRSVVWADPLAQFISQGTGKIFKSTNGISYTTAIVPSASGHPINWIKEANRLILGNANGEIQVSPDAVAFKTIIVDPVNSPLNTWANCIYIPRKKRIVLCSPGTSAAKIAISEEITEPTKPIPSHTELPGRDANNSHPIAAITGLQPKLDELENGILPQLGANRSVLTINSEGVVGWETANDFILILPPMSPTAFGVAKVGAGLAMDERGALSVSIRSNQAGQVKANYIGLFKRDFKAGEVYYPSVRAITPTLSPRPITLWPNKAVTTGTNAYSTGFFIKGATEADDRFIENPVPGQVHRWRILGSFYAKPQASNAGLYVSLVNTNTSFSVTEAITLPSGTASGFFTAELTTIASSDSIGVGKGYRLSLMATMTDTKLQVDILNITRISEAIDVTEGFI